MLEPIDWGAGGIPEFSTYLSPVAKPPRVLPPEVPATGTGNWLTAGLGAGFHGATSEFARALQAGAQITGATGAAQSLADFAHAAHERAQTYARPDLEASPWSLPGLGYQLARMVPVTVATLGGAALGAAAGPEVAIGATAAALARAATVRGLAGGAGATAATYPFVAGANVERQISETGELTTPGKALAWGVPEAVVQAILPAKLETLFGKGIWSGIKHGVATQGFAGGATEWMTQQLGDPDRNMADRAAAIGHAALSGAALGGIISGGVGGYRKLVGTPTQKILDDPKAMADAVDQVIAPPGPEPTQLQLPLPRVPGKDIQELPLFGRQLAGEPAAPVPAVPAPAAPTLAAPEQLPLSLPRVPEGLQDLPLFAQRPEVVPTVPAAPVAPLPVLDFTARVTERSLKEGMAQVAVAPPEAQAVVKQQLIDTIVARGDKPLTVGLKKWGEAFDILTPEGKLRETAPVEPAAPAAPAAPVPVLDFTKGAVKTGGKLYRAALPADQVTIRQPLVDEIIARKAEGKEPTRLQEIWANELGIWDELEKAAPKQTLETPPGVTPEVKPEVLSAVEPTKPSSTAEARAENLRRRQELQARDPAAFVESELLTLTAKPSNTKQEQARIEELFRSLPPGYEFKNEFLRGWAEQRAPAAVEVPGVVAPAAEIIPGGPLRGEGAKHHMPAYERGWSDWSKGIIEAPKEFNQAEVAAWDRGAEDRMNADRAARGDVVAPIEQPEPKAGSNWLDTLTGKTAAPKAPAEIPLHADIPDFLQRKKPEAASAKALPGKGVERTVGDRVMMPPEEGGAPVPHEVVEFTKDGTVTVKDPSGRLITGLQQAYVNARPLAAPEALGAGQQPLATSVASKASITTAEDRVAALNGIRAEIAKLPDSEAKFQHDGEARAVTKLLPRVEDNPGLADRLNARIDRLRNQLVAEARPPDHVATPDLAPSPHAEAVPAPTGDLTARLGDAQSALSGLKTVLGNRPEVRAAIEQDAKFLAEVNRAIGEEQIRAALAKDPELNPDADNLGNLGQISKSQQDKLNEYLTTQREAVLQAARADSGTYARVITSRDGLPVTQLDADVADHTRRGVRAVDTADHIIERISNPEEAEIVAKLRSFLPEDTKTVFREGVLDKEGEYFPKQKTIAIYNAANSVATFIHEMVHAVTHRALEGTSAAARAMRGIYEQLKDKGDHAGITDAHEMVSEGMANPVYRDFLKSQMVKGTSLWDRFVDTVRGFIGLDPRLHNAFDRIMSHGEDLMKEQRQYPNSEWMGRDSYALRANEGTGTAARAADEGGASILEKISNGRLNVKEFLRGVGNGWSNGHWLARTPEYNKLSANIAEFVDSIAMEDPRKKQIGKAAIVADRQARALPAEGQELVSKVMAASTAYGYRPGMSLADYTERIHNNPTETQKFNVVNDLWNQLGKIPGGQEAFNTWRSVMSELGHMTATHNLQAVGRRIDGLPVADSFRKFDMRGDLTNQPKLRDEHWQKELDSEIKGYTEFNKQLSTRKAEIDAQLAEIQFKKDYPKELVEQSSKLGSQIEQLGEAIKLAEAEQKRMVKEPYFHLGRKGDYFATGKLVTLPGAIDPETGKPGKPAVDQKVLSKFMDYLEKHGINDVAIMQGNEHGTFYARVESPAQLAALSKVMEAAQESGLLGAKSLATGKILDPHIFNRISSKATQDIIERLRANRPVAPEGTDQAVMDRAHTAQIQDLQRTLLSMTPETSMSRLMAHRQNVQGFSKDMLASQAYAADVSAFGLARRTLQHEVSAAEAGMLKDLEKANSTPGVDVNTRLGLAATIEELMRSQRLRQTFVPKDWKDAARNFTNFLHIGMSPAYVPMQLSQLLVTGVPELAKTHGYGSSFGAITSSMGQALKVLKAIAKSPDGLTAGITLEALQKAGLSPELIKTVVGMDLRGALGTYTESATTARSPLSSTITKVASTLGLYADLGPRLAVGIAADKLYTAKPHPTMTREQFIDRAIGDSQGYYNAALGARQMGRSGFLGSYTPMTLQFQTWNINLMNKIYREVLDVFSGDKQTRNEALTWLGGHAAAVTMLAGTLGLPMVATAASTYDWFMRHATGRDDHDITASYRGFLANLFGKDMGEIIARGLPRAAGVDFANWGEGEIVPGSASLKIFTEKRKWEDVEKDWFKSMGGPALNQMLNLGLTARDITNGDYLEGLGRFMPGLIKGPMEAYKLTKHGDFVDSRGQKLPLTSPNAAQIMLTALGLKPAKLAEYQEVAREASGLKALREQSSANISQHLRQAWMEGDQKAFNAWMGAAQEWQLQHPGLVPPQASFGEALRNHQRQLAQSRGTGLPIGVMPQDVEARRMLRYGNIPVQ